ncbi:hypothetical protein CIB95_11265 [Lottiidibacillus patelloidae]|uniref:Uncharacterized protein n=1 Tax=Lottiidibacillus patelloidae TaxID=2670334 RepID=A0A263BSW3_9BACI|nr:hypothetical protein [Lottiidibacillus patelloidae]OZM56789.1 hypothetical protein CIB95_11265 [Lottiidibacillus patelloidae]
MKKTLVIILLLIVGILASGCSNETIGQETDESLSIRERIEAELLAFYQTAAYARSSEVNKETLIEKLEAHHAAFRKLEVEYANENKNDPFSDNVVIFLMSINERINGLTSFIIHYGIEGTGSFSLEKQFSDSSIDVFDTILETGIAPSHNKIK